MWIRTCQECGHKQPAKPPAEYKDQKAEAWREVKCARCKSVSLDYGKDNTPTQEDE